MQPGKALKLLAKWILRLVLLLAVLLVALWASLQTQWGKNLVKDEVVTYLRNKLHTDVRIGKIQVRWLSHIQLQDVAIADRAGNKLLAVGRLEAGYSLRNLSSKQLYVSLVNLSEVELNVSRRASDSTFNTGFILDALAGNNDSKKQSDGFKFKLDNISLQQVRFALNDAYGGKQVIINAAAFHTSLKQMDLDSLTFTASNITAESIDTYIGLWDVEPKHKQLSLSDNAADFSSLKAAADSINIKHLLFRLDNKSSGLSVNSSAGELSAGNISYNDKAFNASANSLTLRNHSTKVNIPHQPGNSVETAQADSSKSFTFFVQQASLMNNDFSFDKGIAKEGNRNFIDDNHIHVADASVSANNIGYNGQFYSAAVEQASGKEACGFMLKDLHGSFIYSDTIFSANQFFAETNRNILQGSFRFNAGTAKTWTSFGQGAVITAAIEKTAIVMDDFLYFFPGLKHNASIKQLLGKKFLVNSRLSGNLKHLNIPQLLVKEPGISLTASADIYHLDDEKRLSVQLKLKELSGNRNALLSLLPAHTVPDSLLLNIPTSFSVKGLYGGSLDDFKVNLSINSSDGYATVAGSAKSITDIEKAGYNLTLNGVNLPLGKWLKDSLTGKFTGTVNLKGKGWNLATMHTEYDASIKQIIYRNYVFKSVSAKGSIQNNVINAAIRSEDSSLNFNSVTSLDLGLEKKLNTKTTIHHADVRKLGLTTDSLEFSSMINADMLMKASGRLAGNFSATSTAISINSEQLLFDSLLVTATDTANEQAIVLKTPFANASLTGDYTLAHLPDAVQTVANRYFYPNRPDTQYHYKVGALAELELLRPDSILPFIPGLQSLSPFKAQVFVNSDSALFGLYSKIDKIVYNGYVLDTLLLAALNLPSRKELKDLTYNFNLGKLSTPSWTLSGAGIRGTILPGKIEASILLKSEDSSKYAIPGTVYTDDTRFKFVLADSVIINNKTWHSNASNSIYLNANHFKGSSLILSNAAEELQFKADDTDDGLPLQFGFKNFSLSNVPQFVWPANLVPRGICNGTLNIESLDNFFFTSKLAIDSFQAAGIQLGNLALEATKQNDSLFNINAALAGFKNKLNLSGTYSSATATPDFDLDVTRFDVANLSAMLDDYFAVLKGNANGRLHLAGSFSKPLVTGSIHIDTLKANYRDYNTDFIIPSGQLQLDENGIGLKEIHFTDTLGHGGTVSGNINTTDYRDYVLNLAVNAKNFLAVGPRKTPGQLVFGPARVDANITVKGPVERYIIEGGVTLADRSSLTYVYSADDESMGKGLMEFFDPLHAADSTQVQAVTKPSATYGMSVNVKATATSAITILPDELAGDYIKVNGDGDLNVNKEPGGAWYVSGKYLVDKGMYNLSILNLLHRQFTIQKGSSIVWNGDLLKAALDVSGIYNVKTTAGELLTSMQDPGGAARQLLNFEVMLKLSGEMLKPDIAFTIDMPENERALFDGMVYTRIKQINSIPAELNKQVLALLGLNSFIGDNPFSSLGGTGNGNFATGIYNTAGQFVSRELTDILSSLVKGVNIDVGMEFLDDYTTGEARHNANLKVGISKSLLDNRLSVYVGSSFNLENQNQHQNALDEIAGNIIVEYLLTRTGKYRVKAFRTTENELTLQGTVVKTGASFVLVFEFDKVKKILFLKKPITVN